jgi:hypothetical protein
MPNPITDKAADEYFDGATLPDIAPAPAAPPQPPIVVRAVPKDPKFTVMLDERLPRQDTVLMQVSVPQDIHQRLKYDSMGSMNHVLMGLVRYALEKLDEEGKTLRIERNADA